MHKNTLCIKIKIIEKVKHTITRNFVKERVCKYYVNSISRKLTYSSYIKKNYCSKRVWYLILLNYLPIINIKNSLLFWRIKQGMLLIREWKRLFLKKFATAISIIFAIILKCTNNYDKFKKWIISNKTSGRGNAITCRC